MNFNRPWRRSSTTLLTTWPAMTPPCCRPSSRTAALVNGSREGLQVAQHVGVIGQGGSNSLKAWMRRAASRPSQVARRASTRKAA